jgi:hypothetical protein
MDSFWQKSTTSVGKASNSTHCNDPVLIFCYSTRNFAANYVFKTPYFRSQNMATG